MTSRLVFMGSPEFSVPILRGLTDQYSVVGVVTQPDRPSGRGRSLSSPPVKWLADELGLPVFQPERLKEPAALQRLQDWHPDLIVVAAFGQILRKEVLELPTHGCINVHASLLPRWRGAAPIQAALLHGDRETGVTIICMDPGVDTGPTLTQRALPIQPDDTAASLGERLSRLGAQLLLETLPSYLRGELTPQPQDETRATYAPQLKKRTVGWTLPSPQKHWSVACAHSIPGPVPIRIGRGCRSRSCALTSPRLNISPTAIHVGQRCSVQKQPAIGTADGLLVLDEVQSAGKKPMPGKAFLAGVRVLARLRISCACFRLARGRSALISGAAWRCTSTRSCSWNSPK